MSSFPGSPRLLKSAIVGIDHFNPLAIVVVFQCNPDTTTRKLEPRAVAAAGDRGEAFRLTGAPKETITLSIEIDSTDQLEQANPLATTMGTYPSSPHHFPSTGIFFSKAAQPPKPPSIDRREL